MVSYCTLTDTLNNVEIKDNYAHGLPDILSYIPHPFHG